jgi:hypothetical protein
MAAVIQLSEFFSIRMPAGTRARIAAVLRPGEDVSQFVRMAVEAEIAAREAELAAREAERRREAARARVESMIA